MCAFVVFYALRKPGYAIQLKNYFSIRPDLNLIVKILAIGVPSGIENGMFQFGNACNSVYSIITWNSSNRGTGDDNHFRNVNGMAAVGIGIGLMTVVGQSIGAGRQEEAKYYIVKLAGYAEIAMIISCILVYIAARPVTVHGRHE